VDASEFSNVFASLEKRFKKDVGKELQTILPVQVNFGSLVNAINRRISGMEGHITELGEQLRIIEEKDTKFQKVASQLKSQLNSCEESKAKEVASLKEERNSMKEEISRLQEQLKSSGANDGEEEDEEEEEVEEEEAAEEEAEEEEEDGWSRHNGFLFKYFATNVNWDDARDKCQEEGANLVMPKTKSINDFLISNWNGFWIGVSDKEQEGKFVFVDGTEVTKGFWGSNNPNNANEQNCVELGAYIRALWDDRGCEKELPFVCQKG